jgi:hypothetical protein
MYFNILGSITFLFMLYSLPHMIRKFDSYSDSYSPPELCFLILYLVTIISIVFAAISFALMGLTLPVLDKFM